MLACAPATAEPGGATQIEPALLAVSVNGLPAGEPVLLLKSADGSLYASDEEFKQWRISRGNAGSLVRDGTTYYKLSGRTGLKLELQDATQTVLLTADPALLQPTLLSFDGPDMGPMTSSSTGAFLNYEVLGQVAGGRKSLNAAVELGTFTRLGTGVSNFIARTGSQSATGPPDSKARVTRLETNWTVDDPARMRSLRIGDSISYGGVGAAPLRFGGIQFARNFAVQPGFVTLPMPSLAGSAAVPSVVDVYVNNTLRDQRSVPPGPFELTGVPVVSGSGDVQLIVRDLLGRETLVSQSYYAAPQMLRQGLHDYSYEVGFLRRNFTQKSNDYGAAVVSASHRYGVTDSFTAEAHAEATRKIQQGGVAVNFATAGLGFFDLSAAASKSRDGTGAQFGVGYERRTAKLSFGVRAEFATDHYQSVGTARSIKAPTTTVQAFAGVPTRFGSVGASYVWRNGRGTPDVELLSANASFRLGPLGTIHLAGRKSFRGPHDAAVEALFVLPLHRRTTASGGVELHNGRANVTAAIQQNPPAGEGLGYRAAVETGGINRLDADVNLQTNFGAYDAAVTWIDGKSGLRVTAAGGFGVMAHRVFAARKLSQSFAAVKVGHYSGVRIYADNQLVGRTNRHGQVVVPLLRPFDRNTIRMEIADLPLDAQISSGERVVRPYNRSGVAIDFGVKRARGAVARIVLEDGTALPAGATLHLDGQDGDFITAPGGEVYLTGLEARNVARATWHGGACRVDIPFRDTGEPQPRLGVFPCRKSLQ